MKTEYGNGIQDLNYGFFLYYKANTYNGQRRFFMLSHGALWLTHCLTLFNRLTNSFVIFTELVEKISLFAFITNAELA